jgi:hypothetical protein
LAYSPSIASYSHILISYSFEVLILALLCKGNIIVILKVYNTAIEFKIMGRGEALMLLSQESSLL